MTVYVPLAAVKAQKVSVVLGGQTCQLVVYQKTVGMFIDVYVNNALIIGGVLCHNACKIVRDAYLGFIGDLSFYDTVGSDDPDYTGLGSRWQLAYLS